MNGLFCRCRINNGVWSPGWRCAARWGQSGGHQGNLLFSPGSVCRARCRVATGNPQVVTVAAGPPGEQQHCRATQRVYAERPGAVCMGTITTQPAGTAGQRGRPHRRGSQQNSPQLRTTDAPQGSARIALAPRMEANCKGSRYAYHHRLSIHHPEPLRDVRAGWREAGQQRASAAACTAAADRTSVVTQALGVPVIGQR
jgi:hypothetical protein